VISDLRERRLLSGSIEPRADAADERARRCGSATVFRAVLTTAAAAAFGFLPMAISTGAGAEVQRPLATVVAVGISVGALTSLAVLPGILYMFLRHHVPRSYRSCVRRPSRVFCTQVRHPQNH
jgi:Cu/Ag efflux pump CusA